MLPAISIEHAVITVLSVLLTVSAVKLLFRVDRRLEKYQRMALAASRLLQGLGFERGAKIAENVAIKDLGGAWGETARLVEDLLDPKMGPILLREAFAKQLTARLNDAVDCPEVLKAVTAFAAGHPEALTAAGLALAAKV